MATIRIIVRGRYYETDTKNDLLGIESMHSVTAQQLNATSGVFISDNDNTSIVGHWVITD